MALSPTQKAQLAEILRIPSSNLVADDLTRISAEQTTILAADIDRYWAIRGKYGDLVPTAGSGVAFSPRTERADIRARIIIQLDVADLVNRYKGYNGGGNVIQRA